MLKIKSCAIGLVALLPGVIAKLVLTNKVKTSTGRIHHILKWDISGSMSWAINQIKRDLNGYVATLPKEDFVSIITFSGHGEARQIAGPLECNESGKKALGARIDAVRILGTTVFSEGLGLALLHPVTDMLPKKIRQQVILFTDGCPVPTQWSESQEMEKSKKYAVGLHNAGATLSTIGYGNYYNDTFLSDLVQANGGNGTNRHINDVTNFGSVIAEIRNTEILMTPVIASLEIKTKTGKAGRVLRSTPEIRRVGDNGSVLFNSIMDNEITLFVSLPANTTEFTLTGTVDGDAVNETVKGSPLSKEEAVEATLANASWNFQKGNLKEAAELLKASGNDVLALMAENAYTDRERLTIADEMRRILLDHGVRQRYSTKKFIGKGETPCVVNLLRTLLDEDCTVFIPKGTYQRTTETVIEEGMRHKPNAKIKMTEIQSNEKRYNISMKTVVDVEEKDSATGRWKDGVRFRNYVVIKDGNLHQDTLEAYLTPKAFDLCVKWGVVSDGKYSDTTLYTLDLTVLPMIVASWANPKQLGLVALMQEELILEVKQKAINTRVKELRMEAIPYPDREKVEGTDSYSAPAYEYELKGFKAPTNFDFSSITEFTVAEAETKKTRRRLLNIRCVKRLILFAMDKSGNKLFDGVLATPVKRSTTGKMEQIVNLASLGEPSLSLRRITWTETVKYSASASQEEAAA